MVWFSCFSLHACSHNSKKGALQHTAQIFPRKMQKETPVVVQDPGAKESPVVVQDPGAKESPSSACSNWNADSVLSMSTPDQTETPTFGCGQLEEFNEISCVQDDREIHLTSHMRKSQSLGSGLDREEFSFCNESEAEFQGRFLLDDSNENDHYRGLYSSDRCGSVCYSLEHHDSEMKYQDEDQVVRNFVGTEDHAHHANQKSLFSIGDIEVMDRGLHGESFELSTTRDSGPGNFAHAKPCISKSHSLPLLSGSSNLGNATVQELPQRTRSFDDLSAMGIRAQFSVGPKVFQNRIALQPQALFDSHVGLPSDIAENNSSCMADSLKTCNAFSVHSCSGDILDQGRYDLLAAEHDSHDVQFNDGYISHNLNEMLGDTTGTPNHDAEIKQNNQADYSFQRWDELTDQDLNMRRVEHWLSQMDIHEKCYVEEIVAQDADPVAKMEDNLPGTASLKSDNRANPGIEAAYNYISSLNAISTSAQMAGLGLVVIPFLGAFTSLRLVNLSGNSIVRITAGALPRGLHKLNLSRNNISTIEGFRELTRLRVLDLSYNRILRIGHGLSACSSLKELYLAGNKISEVEGLHRLLKLSILDLHNNKISTTKCLGQLAANYASLQAINLDGNPAQRNVGDEQLRKYVLSLLPHLVYYNNHTFKVSTSKEVSDRSSRSNSSHQLDRSLRSEQKRSRRAHHGSTSQKTFATSSHGRSSAQVAHPRTAHAPLPPLGAKPGHLPTVDPKLLTLELSSSIRRSRSAGNLG